MDIKSKIAARFKVIVRNKDDDFVVEETDWVDNLVLDTGLKRMSSGIWIDRCCVGTGTTEPLVTDTALTSFKSSTGNLIAASGSAFAVSKPYYTANRLTFRLPVGASTGVISEVGLGWDNTSLWNKCLLKNSLGVPTPVTVTANDYLDVLVELRVYFQDDFSGTINLLNMDNSVASTHNYTGKMMFSTQYNYTLPFERIYSQMYVLDYSSNNNYAINSSHVYTMSENSYPTQTSYKGVLNIVKNEANAGHKLLQIVTNLGQRIFQNQPLQGSGFKIELTPPIIKTNTMALQHSFTLSWARYVA